MAENPENLLVPSKKNAHLLYLFEHECLFSANRNYVPNRKAKAIRNYAVLRFKEYSKSDRLDAQISYRAQSYFDRFVSRNEIKRVAINPRENQELFVICCLAIAWKLKKGSLKRPRFMETLIKFKPTDIVKMELQILNKLEWRVSYVTPISFAECFMEFFEPNVDENTEATRIVKDFIVMSQSDIRITRFRHSAIAAYSALETTSKVIPQHLDAFQAYISESCLHAKKLLNELVLYKADLESISKKMLMDLISRSETAKSAIIVDPEVASASILLPAGRRSEPIEIGSDSPGTSVQHSITEALLEGSIPHAMSAEEKRAGKKPMVEEIKPVAEPQRLRLAKCIYCTPNPGSYRPVDMKRHMKSSHSNLAQKFCTKCEVGFKRKELVDLHKKEAPPSPPRHRRNPHY